MDRDALLAFHDDPAEHWVHIRTTGPIESTFATAKRSRNCSSRETTLAMVSEVLQSAPLRIGGEPDRSALHVALKAPQLDCRT